MKRVVPFKLPIVDGYMCVNMEDKLTSIHFQLPVPSGLKLHCDPQFMQNMQMFLTDVYHHSLIQIPLDIVDIEGITPFQLQVYHTLIQCPRGAVMTYGELSEKSGFGLAARAVGTAMAKNPLPLLIPCHRVIQSSGELGQYNGGKDLKRAFLENEGATLP
ncbi:MAG: MGMT family protein [Candidatus Margulisbacteria bacterium]|nr:MGMT family protein [Candidatus Margulisiibacteriota bacterium]